MILKLVFEDAGFVEVYQEQFDAVTANNPVLQERIRCKVHVSTMEPPANLSANIGDLNPNRLLGIYEIHMIAQQVAEISDARFNSIFEGKRMIAESPVLRNEDALALLRGTQRGSARGSEGN